MCHKVYLQTRQDSNKRKIAAHADGEAAPATKADLQATELKRWPDYEFLIGATESGKTTDLSRA